MLTGWFNPPFSYAVGRGPEWVTAGDINNDGHLDLVTANSISVDASVLLGRSPGGFQVSANTVGLNGGTDAESVALGDFNRDGKLDLVGAVSFANFPGAVDVHLGNGDGTFQPFGQVPADTTYTTGVGPVAVAVGDFNNDGIPDFVVLNGGNPSLQSPPYGSVSLFLGNGDGTFTLKSTTNLANQTYGSCLAVGDFNGDGKLDVAVASTLNSVYLDVLLQNAQGDLVDANDYVLPGSGNGPGIALGDFNADGKLDVAVTLPNQGKVEIIRGIGDGTFQLQGTLPFNVGTNPVSIAVASFDGDILPDLAVANIDSNNIFILEDNGNFDFILFQILHPVYSGPVSLTILHYAGADSLAVANEFSDSVWFYLNVYSSPGAAQLPPGPPNSGDYLPIFETSNDGGQGWGGSLSSNSLARISIPVIVPGRPDAGDQKWLFAAPSGDQVSLTASHLQCDAVKEEPRQLVDLLFSRGSGPEAALAHPLWKEF